MARASQRILIGLSCTHRLRLDSLLMRFALKWAGADVFYLSPGSPVPLEQLDGLVIGGGAHLHPSYFGEEPSVKAVYLHQRDRLELSLLDFAGRRGLPVLGICRGAQALNISRGGSLIQDITPFRRATRSRNLLLPLQPAHIASESRLSRLLKRRELGVNRLHSQAMRRFGNKLRAVAWDADGFTQAIESTDDSWQFGVQWHPEYLLYHPVHRRLFNGLVEAAERYHAARILLQENQAAQSAPPGTGP